MSNVIEFKAGKRNVMIQKDNVPMVGAVLATLTEKPLGLSRYGVLKSPRVASLLQGRKITKEADQINEIGKTFSDLHGKGLISLSGDKVQTAKFVNDYADLAKEIVEMAEKTTVSTATTTAKRGRPAGSGKSATSKDNAVQRNPAPVKGKRFFLLNGKVTPFGVGKPNKDKLLSECDENGKNIADIAAIEARFTAQEASKVAKVQRNPKVSKSLRFYLKDGVVTPFGLGKPGYDKLSNECTQAGERIDNTALVATLRQPKQSSGTGGNSSKINQLEAQLAQLTEMMKAMMTGGFAAPVPQQVQQVTVPAAVAEVAKVEVAQVTETIVEKPAKAAKSAKPSTSKAKPAKAAKVAKAKDIDEDDDPYGSFANNVNDFGDDEPIAFGSDGFVVTEIDC
jgi:hypothetical protein